ncbi:MAG: hypothetical protein H7276_04615 [Caulobacter sp.]|nr:hypothetical protein [Vitreoscilla sp.]
MPIEKSGDNAKLEFSASEPGAPVCACGGTAPFDPSYVTSTVPEDLQPHLRGVYGYVPKPGTEFSKPEWPDWTDKEAVAKAKLVRAEYHQGLEDEKAWVADMRQKGTSDEAIARELVDIRNKARLSKYPEDKLPMIFERNQNKYQNKYGPTYESLLKAYKTPDKVILAGTRSNTGMDVLCGVATVVPKAKL